MRKFISLVTILSLILMTTGCYSKKVTINPVDIRNGNYGKYSSLKVETTDSKQYQFKNVKLEGDSFVGTDKQGDQTTLQTKDISKVTTSKFSAGNTIAVTFLGLVVVSAIFLGIYAAGLASALSEE